MIPSPAQVRVILVRPEGEANMGATARAMACFGLTDLVLVRPYRQPAEEAMRWACHGASVLETARRLPTLPEALEGVNLSVGLTRRAGKRRPRMHGVQEFLEEILPGYPPGRLALVFGTEESGLSNEELDLCQRLVTLPSLGSLNLSHAVSITLYELFGRAAPPPVVQTRAAAALASPEERAAMRSALGEHLRAMGYPYHRATLEEELGRLGDILERARLEAWEIRFLVGMFRHLRLHSERLALEGAGGEAPNSPGCASSSQGS